MGREEDAHPWAQLHLHTIAIRIRQLDGWMERSEEGLVLPTRREGFSSSCRWVRLDGQTSRTSSRRRCKRHLSAVSRVASDLGPWHDIARRWPVCHLLAP